MTKKKVVLFGCGQIATEFYREYKKDLDIAYIISNNPKEKTFQPEEGVCYEVRRPKEKDTEDVRILLCSAAYEDMAEQLMLLGYTPFVDFMDYELASVFFGKKKIALLYGFCHLRGIRDCLNKTEAFSKDYVAFFYPNYLKQNAYQQEKFEFLIENCQVFLYGMAVSEVYHQKNRAVLSRLKSSVLTMCLHTVYFGGYFPQKERTFNALNRMAVRCENQDYTPFSYGDSWLNRCIEQGMSADDVKEVLTTETIYERDFVLKYLEKEWVRLKYQEKQSDFRILSYIEENYRNRRLFRNESHMENEILEEYTRQVLERMGLKREVEPVKEPLLMCSEHLIYPCVADALELQWNVLEEELDLYTYGGWEKVRFDRFLEMYMEVGSQIFALKKLQMLP